MPGLSMMADVDCALIRKVVERVVDTICPNEQYGWHWSFGTTVLKTAVHKAQKEHYLKAFNICW